MKQTSQSSSKTKKDRSLSVMKTISLKIRNPHTAFLEQGSFEVNQIWNYINDVSFRAIRSFAGKPQFLSVFDLDKLTGGITYDKQENPEGFKVIKQSVPRCRHLLKEMTLSLKAQPTCMEQQTMLASYREVG